MDSVSGVSVVIITRDEEDYIEECLRSVAAALQRAAVPAEIVVVDGQSTDDTVARARAWAAASPIGRTLHVAHCDPGYSRQRNLGVRVAAYQWIAFISADVRPDPDWLRQTVECLDGSADTVIGRIRLVSVPGRGNWLAELTPTLYPTCTDQPGVERCSNAHLIARRSSLLGERFREDLPACEDKDMAYRLRGGGFAYSSSFPQHLARESIGRFFAKVHAEAKALGVLASRHGKDFPDCFGWGRCARRSLVLSCAAAAAATAAGLAGVPWLSPLALMAWLVAANRHPVGWRRRKPGSVPWIALRLVHLGAMLWITEGYLAGRIASRRQAPAPSQGVVRATAR